MATGVAFASLFVPGLRVLCAAVLLLWLLLLLLLLLLSSWFWFWVGPDENMPVVLGDAKTLAPLVCIFLLVQGQRVRQKIMASGWSSEP